MSASPETAAIYSSVAAVEAAVAALVVVAAEAAGKAVAVLLPHTKAVAAPSQQDETNSRIVSRHTNLPFQTAVLLRIETNIQSC